MNSNWATAGSPRSARMSKASAPRTCRFIANLLLVGWDPFQKSGDRPPEADNRSSDHHVAYPHCGGTQETARDPLSHAVILCNFAVRRTGRGPTPGQEGGAGNSG